jgi:hypothetical protein
MQRGGLILVTLVLGVISATMDVTLPQARAQEATPAASCVTTGEDENEAAARRWYDEALDGADLSVLDEILSPDVV